MDSIDWNAEILLQASGPEGLLEELYDVMDNHHFAHDDDDFWEDHHHHHDSTTNDNGFIRLSSSTTLGWLDKEYQLRHVQFRSTTACLSKQDVSTRPYNSKALLQCVAHALPTPPALFPSDDTVVEELLVIDCGTQGGMFLAKVVPTPTVLLQSLRPYDSWSNRPFLYSSALHPHVAMSVVGIVQTLLETNKEESNQDDHSLSGPCLLDPTCGSGTLLAAALSCQPGVFTHVQGWDVRKACVEGTRRNLHYLCTYQDTREDGNSNDGPMPFTILQRDAATTTTIMESVHAVVANLPWGDNSVLYREEQVKIVSNLSKRLRPGVVCVWITKTPIEPQDDKEESIWHHHLEIIGHATIPPSGFFLPTSKKGKQGDNRNGTKNKASTSCVVTVTRVVGEGNPL